MCFRKNSQPRIQSRHVVGERVDFAIETADIDAARHQFGFFHHVFAGIATQCREGLGGAGKDIAAKLMRAMRSDVANQRREVGFDIPAQLLEHAVERGKQRRVAAVIGVAQGFAPEKWQAGQQRRGGADGGVGGVDGRFGKITVIGNSEISLHQRQVEAHACPGVAQQRLRRAGRLAQQVIQAALDQTRCD